MAVKFYVNIAEDDYRLKKHFNPLEAIEEAKRIAKKDDKIVYTLEVINAVEKMPATRNVDIQETPVQYAYSELKKCVGEKS